MTGFFITIGFLALALAAIGVFWSRYGRPQFQDAVRHATIAQLEEGRFRIAGMIVAERTVASPFDGLECVFFEHADYRPVGSGVLAKETERWSDGRPFYVDDGTGRVRVDPRYAQIEAAVFFEDAGLTAERRLRVGEEVEVIATFALADSEKPPYRGAGREWHCVVDESGGPRISYRTMPDMLIPGDEVATFLRAASAFLLGIGLLLATLVGLVS